MCLEKLSIYLLDRVRKERKCEERHVDAFAYAFRACGFARSPLNAFARASFLLDSSQAFDYLRTRLTIRCRNDKLRM